jgi:hypothetical protein
MSAVCKFCQRSFRSRQGVVAHLKSCPQYQPMIRKRSGVVLGKSLREFSLPKAARSHEQIQEDIRRKREFEASDWRFNVRTVVVRLHMDVVDHHGPSSDVPEEGRIRAKAAIEKEVWLIPRLDLLDIMEHHFEGLISRAEQIRDREYRRYQIETEEIKKRQQEVKKMSKKRILTGDFICPKCEEEFALDREPEDKAFCDFCRIPLEELNDNDEQEEEEANPSDNLPRLY